MVKRVVSCHFIARLPLLTPKIQRRSTACGFLLSFQSYLQVPLKAKYRKLASMAGSGTISLYPIAALFKVYYSKEGSSVIRPIAIASGNSGGYLCAFRDRLAAGQDDGARCGLAADRGDLRAKVIEIDQECLVFPSVSRPAMAHGAAISAVLRRRPRRS